MSELKPCPFLWGICRNSKRDRLIELIDDYIHTVDVNHWYSEELDEGLADHLLANGVVGLSAVEKIRIYEAIYALADMVLQFGYTTKFRKQDAICDGGLSALEYAIPALADLGCKTNSNGTITIKNLIAFQEIIRADAERALEELKNDGRS